MSNGTQDKPVTVEDLSSQIKSLKGMVEKAGDPNYRSQFDQQRAHFGENRIGFWSQDDKSMQDVVHHDRANFLRKSLPNGYRGAHNEDSKFKSMSHFVQEGLLDNGHKSSEFQSRHKSVFKGIEGMSISAGSDGGYLLPPEYAQGILSRMYTNNIQSRCDNYTVGTNNMKFRRNAETSRKTGKRNGGLQSFWVGEGQPATGSHPKISMVDLYCKKLVVVCYLTEELIKDSAGAAESWIDRVVSDEFDFMIGDAVFNGTGIGMPIGIHNAPNRVVVADGGAGAGTITEGIVDRMWERRAVASAGSYEWFHNQDCCAQLDGLTQDVGTGGTTLYRPGGSIATAPYQTLKGARRTETEFNETCGTEGDLTLADLSKYITISNGGITQQASIHVEFLSGQTALKFTLRIDGQPWENTPIEPYKGSNLQSATIVCETRS